MSSNVPPIKVSTLRATWVIVTFALVRMRNRLTAFYRRKSKDGVRTGTARKRSVSILLLFFLLLFLFNGFMQSTRVLHNVALRAERVSDTSTVVVDRYLLQDMTLLDAARGTAAYDDAERERLRAGLENAALWEGGFTDKEGAEKLAAEHLSIFEKRGASAFRASKIRVLAPFLASRGIWYPAEDSRFMLLPLGIVVALLTLTVLLVAVTGNQELSKTEWSFEWWFTFPVPAQGLLLARVLETAVASGYQWFVLFPFLTTIFVCSGFGFWSPILGALGTLYTGLLAGSLRVVTETVLRRYLSFRALARIQSLLAILGPIPFLLAFGATSRTWLDRMATWSDALPSWVFVNPFMISSLAGGGHLAWSAAVGCTFLAIAMPALAVFIGGLMIRDGLVREGGTSGAVRRRATRDEGDGALAPGLRKELKLLFRNRVLLARTFMLPFVMLATQAIVNPSIIQLVANNARYGVTMAFGVAGLSLTSGGTSALASDVQALWILFTLPRPLDRLLLHKAYFWASIGGLIAIITFVVAKVIGTSPWYDGLPLFLLALVGIVLNAFIATGIGILGTDPLETEPQRRVRASMVYLVMTLVGMYAYGLYAPSAWTKFAQVVLYALLAFALWQKVRDHAPYLLDPESAPPKTIAVADGIIVALSFFVLQGLVGLVLSGSALAKHSPGMVLFITFTVSGALTAVVSFLVFFRSGVIDLRKVIGLIAPRGGIISGLALGVVAGIACGLLGWGYLAIVDSIEPLRKLQEESMKLAPSRLTEELAPWFAALAIFGAPLFEEYIFRGVLFGGFRRTIGPTQAAVASALVFAIVHPAMSFVPVFGLGLAAALAYQRTGSLITPILSHFIYNAMVVGFALSRAGR